MPRKRKREPHFWSSRRSIVEPTKGFEPLTPALRVRCSGQLSYVGLFAVPVNLLPVAPSAAVVHPAATTQPRLRAFRLRAAAWRSAARRPAAPPPTTTRGRLGRLFAARSRTLARAGGRFRRRTGRRLLGFRRFAALPLAARLGLPRGLFLLPTLRLPPGWPSRRG